MTENTVENAPIMPDMHTPLRVVVEHRTGRLAGLHQIVGTTNDLPSPWPIADVLEAEARRTLLPGNRRRHGTEDFQWSAGMTRPCPTGEHTIEQWMAYGTDTFRQRTMRCTTCQLVIDQPIREAFSSYAGWQSRIQVAFLNAERDWYIKELES